MTAETLHAEPKCVTCDRVKQPEYSPCPDCGRTWGTGRAEPKSVQKRIAAQKGEPDPDESSPANPIGGVSEERLQRLISLYEKADDDSPFNYEGHTAKALRELLAARAQRSADVDALNLKDEQIIKLSRELEVAEAVRSDHAALISSLTARLEQCERDARDISRYHFLRALSDSEWELFGQIPEYEMDAAIDAAMLPKEG